MKRHGIAAKIRPGLDWPGRGGESRRVLPFRRAWKAIAVLAVLDACFIVPAVFVFRQAAGGWADSGDLFGLVIAVFSSAWLIGWSLVPLILTTVLLLMAFGREVVRVRGGKFELFIGLPMLGLVGRYDPHAIRNLRIVEAQHGSNKAWRGRHLAFDYGANTVELGSDADAADLRHVQRHVAGLIGHAARTGEATPEELAGDWEPPVVQKLSTSTEALVPEVAPPQGWLSPSVLALIIANLVPVAGTMFLGWNLGDVMVLYWAESAVIGFFNLAKMVVIGRWLALFMGTFFIAHFGGFMAGHFLFIWGIFVKGFEETVSTDVSEVVAHFLTLWPALAALFVSHAISFFRNFLGRREFANRTINDQMGEPYGRIIWMHLAIILGGGMAMILGDTIPVLLLIIAIKIVVDVRAHIKEHLTRV